MQHPPLRRSESHATGTRGSTLFRRSWLPENPERAVLVVHGLAEHSGRYEGLAAWFAERGCAVHAYDHQGHGRSSGTRCHVRRFDDLLDDLDQSLNWVRAEHPDLPIFLVGHSMGGLIVAALVVERRPEVAGAVMSGAALAVERSLSPARAIAVRVLSAVAPRLSFPSGLDPNGLSRDPEVVRAYLEDPLVHLRLTVSLAAGLASASRRTASAGARVAIPLLILHGEADPICPVDGSRAFHAQVSVPGTRLHVYPKLRHEIFNEPERETVFQNMLDWLAERKPRVAA